MGLNHWVMFDGVARALPERTALAWRGRHTSYGELHDRTLRLADVLKSQGLGSVRPRSELAGWESGQDHVGLYLHNGPEYLEATFAANAIRAVPYNINYRYVEHELEYLLNDANTAALVYHSAFAPTLATVLPQLKRQPLLLQVADESGHPLLAGALDYETALAEASPADVGEEQDPDDLYILYTGGTTGMPKGTLWRQSDIFDAVLVAFSPALGARSTSKAEHAAAAVESTPQVCLPLPPFMHGAAQWMAIGALMGGHTVVIQDVVTRLDAADVWHTIEREQVAAMIIVGDAFARPLCDELEKGGYSPTSLAMVITGGATTSPAMKQRFISLLPSLFIADAVGSSETGSQLNNLAMAGGEPTTTFSVVPGTCVVDETMTRVLEAGHEGVGWLAKSGAIPLGYLGDEEKTKRTFPVVEGQRMVVPGDRARLLEGGLVELLGRESVTINSGGEKIFAEEVEQAIVRHPGVDDVLVVGRPNERWGQEIVAVLQLHDGATPSDDEILAVAGERVASYKLPKVIVRVDRVGRSPSGKPDYAWARQVAIDAG